MKGSDLPKDKQEQLKKILEHKATQRLINDIMTNPPKIDLDDVEIVLAPEANPENVDVLEHDWTITGGCETCSAIGGGCETCSAIGGGCETCSAIS